MFRAAEADSVVRYLSACSQEVARAIATSAETAAITSAAGVASMGSDGDPTSGWRTPPRCKRKPPNPPSGLPIVAGAPDQALSAAVLWTAPLGL